MTSSRVALGRLLVIANSSFARIALHRKCWDRRPRLQRRAGKVVMLGIVLFLVVVGALVLAASAGEYDPDVMDPSSPDAPMYEEEYYSED